MNKDGFLLNCANTSTDWFVLEVLTSMDFNFVDFNFLSVQVIKSQLCLWIFTFFA